MGLWKCMRVGLSQVGYVAFYFLLLFHSLLYFWKEIDSVCQDSHKLQSS